MSDSERSSRPYLEPGEVIPAFTLPGTDGMPRGPWDYKQRDHLLLLFTRSISTSEGCGLLQTFAPFYKALREQRCAILGISADPVIANLLAQERLQLPFPLLADPSGNVIQRYTSWEPATRMLQPSIVLADRYNALYQQWTADNEAGLPPVSELLDALQYMNTRCTP